MTREIGAQGQHSTCPAAALRVRGDAEGMEDADVERPDHLDLLGDPPGCSEPPPHIRLCRRIMRRNCTSCTVRLVTPENVRDYLPDLPSAVNDVSVLRKGRSEPSLAIKVGFIRAFLIERHGGVYLDSDCIVLRDPGFVFDLLESWDFVTMRRTSAPGRHISIGFYGSKAGGVVISAYANALRTTLAKQTAFKWGDVGAGTITPIVNEHQKLVHEIPEERLHPIVAEEQSQFLEPSRAIGRYLRHDPIAFMLFHRLFEREETMNASEEDLMAGDTVLSEAFRLAVWPMRRRRLVLLNRALGWTERRLGRSSQLQRTSPPAG